MTDTAKPTPGPWAVKCEVYNIFVHSLDPEHISPYSHIRCATKADAKLIAEAGTVYHETGLTPRQLLERVRELEAEQAELVQFFTELANDSVVFGLDTEFGDGFSIGVKTVCDAIKAALGKHGEGV